MPDRLVIEVEGGERVGGLVYRAQEPGRGATLVLAHGAGAGQMSRFMTTAAQALSARGLDVVTFDFFYAERRRRVPDKPERLEACYRAAIRAALGVGALADRPLLAGGKSMGGRIASQLAAAGDEIAASMRGLVFLGYPLHPPGRPHQLRSAHFPAIRAPMLFVQGTRDTFGTPDEIRAALPEGTDARIHVVPGGDHSFKVPAAAARGQEDVIESIADDVTAWIAAIRARAGW